MSNQRKFGWCSTGHHSNCRVAFFSDFDQKDHACKCDCHKEIVVEDEEVNEQACIHGHSDDSDILCRDCWEADMDDMRYTRMKEE